MVVIAEIMKNRCEFDEIEKYVGPILYKPYDKNENTQQKDLIENYIWSVMEPYISFTTIDFEKQPESIFKQVCENLSSDFPNRIATDFLYDVSGSYSFTKNSLEIIHCVPLWNDYVQSELSNINNIGCLSCIDQRVIENKCIMISNKYSASSKTRDTMRIDSVEKSDIVRVIKRRYYFSAILIGNDNITKYYYQEPKYLLKEIFKLDESDTIEKVSVSVLGYNLTFYFRKENTYVNEIATRINGMYKLKGDVLVIHEIDTNVYAGLSRKEIKRLNVLGYGRLYDREIKSSELHPTEVDTLDKDGKQTKKKVIPLWNRYLILDKRMVKWVSNKKCCISCGKPNLVNPIKCNKCFRALYCSQQCMMEFYGYHVDECINEKSSL